MFQVFNYYLSLQPKHFNTYIMIFNKENYPEACEYLGIGLKPTEETPLDSDIETITGILPRLVSDADGDPQALIMCVEISYIIRNLQRVRDELKTKGGAQ